jgi:hypothetical protein
MKNIAINKKIINIIKHLNIRYLEAKISFTRY